MVNKYNTFTLEVLKDIIEQLSLNSKDKRKIVMFTVDERDGVWKDYTETIQFDKQMKEIVKNYRK